MSAEGRIHVDKAIMYVVASKVLTTRMSKLVYGQFCFYKKKKKAYNPVRNNHSISFSKTLNIILAISVPLTGHETWSITGFRDRQET